jgi:hypothetical protein
MHDRPFDRLQRFRKLGADQGRIGLVRDDEKFPIGTSITA